MCMVGMVSAQGGREALEPSESRTGQEESSFASESKHAMSRDSEQLRGSATHEGGDGILEFAKWPHEGVWSGVAGPSLSPEGLGRTLELVAQALCIDSFKIEVESR